MNSTDLFAPEVVAAPTVYATCIAPLSDDALPAEVVANSLQATVNVVGPDKNGLWLVDIEAFNEVGLLSVGSLDDALVEVLLWLKRLAEAWHSKLTGEDE